MPQSKHSLLNEALPLKPTQLSNPILLANFITLVQRERRVSRQVLEYIAEIEKRRLYAEEGFSSTHDWLVRVHGYSHASAGRRVSAAKMLCAVPEAAEKIETGVLCMTTLGRVQTAIRLEEKRSGERMTFARKAEVITEIELKPKTQIEQSLAEIFQTPAPPKEILQPKSDGETRLHLTLNAGQMQKLKRAAELLSHKLDGNSYAGLIEAMANLVIAQKDPLVKMVKPRAKKNAASIDNTKADSRSIRSKASDTKQDRSGVKKALSSRKSIAPSVRNAVYRRDNGCCQFVSKAGMKCLSQRLTQIDHIIPYALGGSNEPENLRLLCRTHNLLMAEKVFGRVKMERTRSY